MTTIDRTGASDAEFRARVAAFDAAPTPPECDPERVETVARAMWEAHGGTWGSALPFGRQAYRRLAAAAIAAMPPSPAEEAVKRVEALADGLDTWGGHHGPAFSYAADRLRAALASPAPAPQGGGH